MTDDQVSAGQHTKRTVSIVPHTHWDREWYSPFQTFRLRLVDLPARQNRADRDRQCKRERERGERRCEQPRPQ